jgi:hypothetical protein
MAYQTKGRFWARPNTRSGGFFQRSGGFLSLNGGVLKLFFDLKRFRVFAFLRPTFSFFENPESDFIALFSI